MWSEQSGDRPGGSVHCQALVAYPLVEGAGAPAAIGEIGLDPSVKRVKELAAVRMGRGNVGPIVGKDDRQGDVIAVGVEVFLHRDFSKRQHGCDGAAFTPPAIQDSARITHSERSEILVLVGHSRMPACCCEHWRTMFERSLIAPPVCWCADPSAMTETHRAVFGQPAVDRFIDSAARHTQSAPGS